MKAKNKRLVTTGIVLSPEDMEEATKAGVIKPVVFKAKSTPLPFKVSPAIKQLFPNVIK